MRRFFFILFILAPLASPVVSLSQMPDWKFFRDREGNSYYYDRAFKIRIADTEGIDYTPVTSSGIDFYFNKGIELINEGRYPEGLFFLKSIRALDDSSGRVRKVQIESAKWMNYLYKKHGTRYDIYDSESAVAITGKGNSYFLINSRLFYKITIPHRPHLLKKEWKYYGKGYGLKFGARLEEKGNYEGFDYIAGMESRILKGGSPSAEDARMIWIHELGADSFTRRETFRSGDRILYDIKYPDGTPFSGVEGVYVNGNTIHIARVFFHDGLAGSVYESVNNMLRDIVLVR